MDLSIFNIDISQIPCYLVKFLLALMAIPIIIMLLGALLKAFSGGFAKDFTLFFLWVLGEIFRKFSRLPIDLGLAGYGGTCGIIFETLALISFVLKATVFILLLLKIIQRIFFRGEPFNWVFATYTIVAFLCASCMESLEQYINSKINIAEALSPLLQCLCG